MKPFNADRHRRPRFGQNISADNLKVPLEEALNMDLKEVVIPGVYPDKLNGDFSQVYLVQIKKIVEIGPNKVLNGGGGHQRSLLLYLSDGHATHKALEVGEIPGLSLNTRPGTKLVLFGPKLKIVGNSFMYLDASMAQVLGGGISELNAKWEMTKSLENRRRDNNVREGGAPAWAPFGQKINKSSLKVTKNSAPQKEEKKNPVFESQRKDAILSASNSVPPKKDASEENMNKTENNGRNNRNQSNRLSQNKTESRTAEPPQKFFPPPGKSFTRKSPDNSNKESTSQPSNEAPQVQTSKEPLKIAQKEPATQAKQDFKRDTSQKPSVSAKPSFHEQFQKSPPNLNNYSHENPQRKSKTFSNGNYSRNQSDIAASHNTGTDYNAYPIASQSYTASSYSSNLPNQSFTQNEFYIENPVPTVVPPTTRNDYDFKTMPLSNQSRVPFPSNAYPPAVNPIQSYTHTSYFDASLQPPLPAYTKSDYGDNCVPPQTLVFTSSAYSDAQPQTPIAGYVANTYDASKLPYTRTHFNEPPPGSFESQSYTRSNYIDGSSQNWIQQVEDNKSTSYQFLKTNYNAIPSQSPPVQIDYDNQSHVHNRNNYGSGNNVPQKPQINYAAPYEMNVASNYSDTSQKPAQIFDQNNYGSQGYVHNNRGNFSAGAFQRKKMEESFAPRGFSRQGVRPPFKPNERPKPTYIRGSRGRGFTNFNQPRFAGPPPQPGVLYEYLDNKLNLNSG